MNPENSAGPGADPGTANNTNKNGIECSTEIRRPALPTGSFLAHLLPAEAREHRFALLRARLAHIMGRAARARAANEPLIAEAEERRLTGAAWARELAEATTAAIRFAGRRAS
jgi:hypothetical protein